MMSDEQAILMCMRRLALGFALLAAAAGVQAGSVSGSQERAAQEYLGAVASGSPQAVISALHPDEVKRMRVNITERLRQDATRGDPGARARLFGEASTMPDIERLTDTAFLGAVAQRLRLPSRAFVRVKGIVSEQGTGKLVHVLVRGAQPEGRGETEVVSLVTLLPYGKEWKAAISSEAEAQIEDLLDGRDAVPGLVPRMAAAPGPSAPRLANPPEILAMLDDADKALVGGRCAEYYVSYMSPNFRRVTAKNAFDTLVTSCTRSESLREQLVSVLRVVSKLSPRFEFGGTRAIYDTAGRGLPFDSFVLERIKDRWYIAE